METEEKEYGCEFLQESVKSITLASKYFAALHEEDTDAFLALHHKAWNALWQSDILYAGYDTRKPNKHLYAIEDVLNGSHASKLPTGYAHEKTNAFSDLVPSNPLYQNLSLFKRLRNESMHAYIKVDRFRNFAIPYLRASFSNYSVRYQDLLYSVKSGNIANSSSCGRSYSDHECKIDLLPTPSDVEHLLVLPISIYSICLGRGEMDLSEEAFYNLPDSVHKNMKDIAENGYKNERKNLDHRTRFVFPIEIQQYTYDTETSNSRFKYSSSDVIQILTRDIEFPFILNDEVMKDVESYLTSVSKVDFRNRNMETSMLLRRLTTDEKTEKETRYSDKTISFLKWCVEYRDNRPDASMFARLTGTSKYLVRVKDRH